MDFIHRAHYAHGRAAPQGPMEELHHRAPPLSCNVGGNALKSVRTLMWLMNTPVYHWQIHYEEINKTLDRQKNLKRGKLPTVAINHIATPLF